ncbi:MAG: CoA-binding protein [Candidatus Rokuibacteriota bacterium]
MDDWRPNLVSDDEGLRAILREARRIAVLGAKRDEGEPSFYVPRYLESRGARISPVNPRLAGEQLFGVAVVPRLTDLSRPVDVIDVFRRPEFLPAHAAEILALPWRPRAVWFQLGIRNDRAAETLARAGIRVVQDRCMMPEHRRLLGTARVLPSGDG